MNTRDEEVARIKRRIAKADRRLAAGVDERQEQRGTVRESEIRERLKMKLAALGHTEDK